MPNQIPSFEEIKEVDRKLTEMRHQYYQNHDLFSFQWWFLLFTVLIPWVIWWKLVDKSRIKDILLYGFVLIFVIIVLDNIGGELQLWSYPYHLIHLIPQINPVDYSVLPVFHMLVYQYFRTWKSFVIANIVMALLFSFIFEPIFVWLRIYELDNWKYIYSFPIYIAKALVVRWLIEFILKKAKGQR